MMRRHLLTLFALFTGLAALQTPAQASTLDTMVFDASAFARAHDAVQGEHCSCEATARAQAERCIVRQPQTLFSRLPAILRPPVVVGPDRALE